MSSERDELVRRGKVITGVMLAAAFAIGMGLMALLVQAGVFEARLLGPAAVILVVLLGAQMAAIVKGDQKHTRLKKRARGLK